MAWFGRNKDRELAEAELMQGFYTAAQAAADSYETAIGRVEEGDVLKLFSKLRTSHLEYADDFKKRVKKLGGDPEATSGLGEFGGRTLTRIQSAGSVRDLLIAMRQGEENGVAMCREALEEGGLSGKSSSLLEAYHRSHIDNIRDLSEQIALRGTYAGTSAEFLAPQWLRYPKAGFWLLEGAVLLIGYLFGRGGRSTHKQGGSGIPQYNAEHAESLASREVGR